MVRLEPIAGPTPRPEYKSVNPSLPPLSSLSAVGQPPAAAAFPADLRGLSPEHSTRPASASPPSPSPGSHHMAAILSELGLSALAESRELLMAVTTSVAIFIGCVVAFLWRRSYGGPGRGRESEPPKTFNMAANEAELEVDDGKKKVTVFFGTQTGTAEGFAKVARKKWRCPISQFCDFCGLLLLR